MFPIDEQKTSVEISPKENYLGLNDIRYGRTAIEATQTKAGFNFAVQSKPLSTHLRNKRNICAGVD